MYLFSTAKKKGRWRTAYMRNQGRIELMPPAGGLCDGVRVLRRLFECCPLWHSRSSTEEVVQHHSSSSTAVALRFHTRAHDLRCDSV